MLVGVAFLPPSFPPSGTQAFYIIKRQNCVYFCNTVYVHQLMGVFCDRLKLGSKAALDCQTGQNKGRYRKRELSFYSSHCVKYLVSLPVRRPFQPSQQRFWCRPWSKGSWPCQESSFRPLTSPSTTRLAVVTVMHGLLSFHKWRISHPPVGCGVSL